MQEFLKGLELADDIVSKILTKYNETVQVDKQELVTLKQTLQQKETELKNVTDSLRNIEKLEPEKIKEELTKAQADMQALTEKHKSEIQDLKLNNAIEVSLLNNNAINNKAVLPFIDKQAISFDANGNVLGLNEQIQNLMQSKDTSFLFKQLEQATIPQGLNIQTGGEPAQSGGMLQQNYLSMNKFNPNETPSFSDFAQQFNN